MTSKPNSERIVITGIGLTSPNGNTLSELREDVLNQKSKLQMHKVDYYDIELPAGLCKYETNFENISKEELENSLDSERMAVFASKKALLDSNLKISNENKHKIALYMGLSTWGTDFLELNWEKLRTSGKERNIDVCAKDKFNLYSSLSGISALVAKELQTTGPNQVLGGACAAGNLALITGAQELLLNEEIDYVLVGGISDVPRSLGTLVSFDAVEALSKDQEPLRSSKPLSEDRTGVVTSEAAVVFVLERLSDAKKRNAKIYAELLSYHHNSDGASSVMPKAAQQQACMEQALSKVNLKPEDIDLVNLHATATFVGDPSEAESINNVFSKSQNTVVNSSKGIFGHAQGAASLLELAANIGSFTDNKVHGSYNSLNISENCKVHNLVPEGKPLDKEIKIMASNSFGMGGINTVIILKRYDDEK